MNGFLLVSLGGALGAAARHGVGLAAIRLGAQGWPWATFTVNVFGSFLMGVLVATLAFRGEAVPGGPGARLFLTTGLLGGFTTFSAFSLEVAGFIEKGEWDRAVVYAGGSVVTGVCALLLGLFIARRVLV